MAVTGERPELIHLEVDRRLGHEWDEWDGTPLPNGGDFDAPPGLFFGWSVLWIAAATAIAAAVLFVLAPRLAGVAPWLPGVLGWGLAGVAGVSLLWWALLATSYLLNSTLLPEQLAERGPLLRLRAHRPAFEVMRDALPPQNLRQTSAPGGVLGVPWGWAWPPRNNLYLSCPQPIHRRSVAGILPTQGRAIVIPMSSPTRIPPTSWQLEPGPV